jgi:multimeric flavodoxin WrbA
MMASRSVWLARPEHGRRMSDGRRGVRRARSAESEMRIVALNGSHRGNRGSTGFLLELMAKGAQSSGADFSVVELAKREISRCLGCFACANRHPRRCVFEGKDEVAAIHEQMRGAALVVYATPIYIFGISSLLKTFFERFMSTADCGDFRVTQSGLFFHDVDRALVSKPFVSLVVCDNLEHETPRNSIEYFHTFSRFLDAPLVGSLVRPTAQGLMLARTATGKGRFPRAGQVFAAYEQAGRELCTLQRITRATERRANQSIIEMPLAAKILMRLGSRRVREAAVGKARALIPAAPQPGPE